MKKKLQQTSIKIPGVIKYKILYGLILNRKSKQQNRKAIKTK
jgi:hypothetical protein